MLEGERLALGLGIGVRVIVSREDRCGLIFDAGLENGDR